MSKPQSEIEKRVNRIKGLSPEMVKYELANPVKMTREDLNTMFAAPRFDHPGRKGWNN